MSADLDITNYDLDDILELFKIPKNFNEADLKRAKQMVMKIHPDKSKLPAEYFLFYSKAYKSLFSIWEFRKKGEASNKETNNGKNTDYSALDYTEKDKRNMLDQFFDTNKNFKKSTNFNSWFNEQFDKHKLTSETENKGYQTWLRSDDGLDDGLNDGLNKDEEKGISMAIMAQEFERKKRQASSLIVHKDVEEFSYNNNSTSLSTDAPSSFDSDIFSTLPFQDLYKAHTENVIPVSEEDYNKREKFKNVNEYVSHRNQQDTKPLTEQQAKNYLFEREKKEEEMATTRAYNLARQTELANKKNLDFWSGIQLLHNK